MHPGCLRMRSLPPSMLLSPVRQINDVQPRAVKFVCRNATEQTAGCVVSAGCLVRTHHSSLFQVQRRAVQQGTATARYGESEAAFWPPVFSCLATQGSDPSGHFWEPTKFTKVLPWPSGDYGTPE